MPRITVIDAGFFSSIQDQGRMEYRNMGVPQSGAMDLTAANYGNQLLQNELEDAVLEMILNGGTYLFSVASTIAVTGATVSVTINDVKVHQNKPLLIKAGDVLSIGQATDGNFMYLAISGGFKTAVIVESRSFYKEITPKDKLKKGDQIAYIKGTAAVLNDLVVKTRIQLTVMKCFPGPEFHLLSRKQQELLLHTSFTISKNWNRMAFQLVEKIENNLKQLKSSPVLPGTVQLTPNGQLIVLMRDAQTTGGYPRVLQLDEVSISIIAQKRPREKVDIIIRSF